ncbi:MAG TPA: aldehyde ferredoxin oxidoreductase N-terminal domain-containing protein [Synergistales bacterium]|nr:aldehyde ferredoxin oxidoreductase N-terminal domain-containing protein [Synergistales bacterium]HRV71748.1 aldehyde ferredoxin oxidoreductase N-terminal domain-containing protein [Thermovirgaceae bacterium]
MLQGRILHVDLTYGKTHIEEEPELFAKHLGGTAVATELLDRFGRTDLDPLDPRAPVILAIGPFSALYPVATKTVSVFRSPLTGELGESHAGGRLAAALRETGVDAVVIRGASKDPVFLHVDGHEISLRSARTFWGQSSPATDRLLREALEKKGRKLSLVRIGPAGERLSPMACATVDNSRHFGRLGLGAVLGSKKLKAIAVSGKGSVAVENPKSYRDIYHDIYEKVVRSDEMKKYHDLGTPANVLTLNAINGLPTRNFSQGFFENAQKISGEAFLEEVNVQHMACAHCPCGCIQVAELREQFAPSHYSTVRVSYDYELIFAVGTQLSISTPREILRLIVFIEKQGWDCMSMGNTLAWATEAFLSGVIDENNTAGLSLSFGDTSTYLEVMRRVSEGQGEFFRDLEKGTAFCSSKYGGGDFAMHYGGLEPAGYLTGENAVMTWIAGVRHSHLDDNGYGIDQKLILGEISMEDQVKMQVREAQWRMVLNSLVICLFARGVYDASTISKGLEALGLDWSPEKLLDLGARALKAKYAWKKKCGFSPERITIPEKMLRVRTSNGLIDRERMKKRLELFLRYAGLPCPCLSSEKRATT